MDFFSYIPVIIAIRNNKFTHFTTPDAITTTDKTVVHQRTLSKLYDDGYPCALLFENEIYLTRELGDQSNNDIKNFVTSDIDWDILIVSPFPADITSTPVEGFSMIEKVDYTTIPLEDVFIASRRLMLKGKNNDLTNLKVYKYTSPFLENCWKDNGATKFMVSKVDHISRLHDMNVKYTWSLYHV